MMQDAGVNQIRRCPAVLHMFSPVQILSKGDILATV